MGRVRGNENGSLSETEGRRRVTFFFFVFYIYTWVPVQLGGQPRVGMVHSLGTVEGKENKNEKHLSPPRQKGRETRLT